MEICVSCIWCGKIEIVKFIRVEQYTMFLCARCSKARDNAKPLEVGGKGSLQQR